MKIEIGSYRVRISFSFNKLVSVEGINSSIGDKHILLWDFDGIENDTQFYKMCDNLRTVQHHFSLPKIHIIQSSKSHYHAYCFFLQDIANTMFVMSKTQGIDWTFFKLGVIRGYWTLRITPKKQDEKFEYVRCLPSFFSEDVECFEALNVVKYVTGV